MSELVDGELSKKPTRELLYGGAVESTSDPQNQNVVGIECGDSLSIDQNLSKETAEPGSTRKHVGDHECRIFAFVGDGNRPHFIFSTPEGWGRFYVNTAHIKHAAADCAKFIVNSK